MTVDTSREEKADPLQNVTRSLGGQLRTPGPAAKILIVDDEPFNVDYLEQELEDAGYRTISATNGIEALRKVATEAPDLILLDVLMPELDGFSVCRILKEKEETQLIPIVIMTALGAKEDRLKGIEAGAYDFLTKPVDERELFARIRWAVKLKQDVDKRLKGQSTEVQGAPLPLPDAPKECLRVASSTVADKLFRREGEYWTIGYQGIVSRINDTLGVRYIAYLLQYPHRQIHVLELVAAVENPRGVEGVHFGEAKNAATFSELKIRTGLGNAGDVFDPQAKAAYKQRLRELHEELEETRAWHDLGRTEKIQEEIDVLWRELRRGIGLGGEYKKTPSDAERARVNVTRAIQGAFKKLTRHHAALGNYLSDTISTGMYCSYAPDLRIPSPWQF